MVTGVGSLSGVLGNGDGLDGALLAIQGLTKWHGHARPVLLRMLKYAAAKLYHEYWTRDSVVRASNLNVDLRLLWPTREEGTESTKGKIQTWMYEAYDKLVGTGYLVPSYGTLFAPLDPVVRDGVIVPVDVDVGTQLQEDFFRTWDLNVLADGGADWGSVFRQLITQEVMQEFGVVSTNMHVKETKSTVFGIVNDVLLKPFVTKSAWKRVKKLAKRVKDLVVVYTVSDEAGVKEMASLVQEHGWNALDLTLELRALMSVARRPLVGRAVDSDEYSQILTLDEALALVEAYVADQEGDLPPWAPYTAHRVTLPLSTLPNLDLDLSSSRSRPVRGKRGLDGDGGAGPVKKKSNFGP